MHAFPVTSSQANMQILMECEHEIKKMPQRTNFTCGGELRYLSELLKEVRSVSPGLIITDVCDD